MIRSAFNFDLKIDRDIALMTIAVTILMTADYYYDFTGIIALDRFILYLLVPMALIVFVERNSPREYGFRLGDWRAGLVLTATVILLSIPILWLVTANDASMQAYYQPRYNAAMPLITFLDLIGWEFMFRGWLVFGYGRVMGANALWVQAVPFALGHLGKPGIETFSTMFGGFLVGVVAWRTRSFLYPFLIHWFISSFTIWVAAGTF